MSGFFQALRILRNTFSGHPLAAKLHILTRFLTCPFQRTLAAIPPGATVLDIGAGHGVGARLALEHGAREVILLEPDLRKSLLPLRHPGLRVVAGYDVAVRGSFDAVMIYDVVYRIPTDEWEPFFRRVFERLNPGGVLILKELDPDRTLKIGWARIQEFLSDTLLGITTGEGFNFETRKQIEDRLRRVGFEQFRAREVDAWYPHPHILYTARRPAEP